MTMIPARISLVTLGALDVAGLRSFYQKLGWTETETSSDTYAVFKTAGVLLSIYPMEDQLRDAGIVHPVAPIPYKGFTFSINVDRREEVDEVVDKVRELGGKVLEEPADAFWGGRTGHFLDPENNSWEVAWNPTAVFNEYGAMVDF